MEFYIHLFIYRENLKKQKVNKKKKKVTDAVTSG